MINNKDIALSRNILLCPEFEGPILFVLYNFKILSNIASRSGEFVVKSFYEAHGEQTSHHLNTVEVVEIFHILAKAIVNGFALLVDFRNYLLRLLWQIHTYYC